MKVNPYVQALIPYSSKELDVTIKLHANETKNYLFPRGITYQYDVQRYPIQTSQLLQEDLARVFGIEPPNIIVGNGSTELLEMCVKTFSEVGDTLLTVSPSFAMYDVYAQMHGRLLSKVPLLEDGTFPIQSFMERIKQIVPSIVFLCTPNNPTGTIISQEDILTILKQTDALVVVDEAYMEFADTASMVPSIHAFSNLLIARTFSKAYGMASARLGYMIGNRTTIDTLNKVKLPYSLNEVSARMGRDALEQQEQMIRFVTTIIDERSKVYNVLLSLGVKVYPSQANFLYIQTDVLLQERLLEYGILIRSFNNGSYRITIGSKEENKQLINALQEVLYEN